MPSDDKTAMEYLRAEYNSFGVDAIVFADSNMKSISAELVTYVGAFASEHAIPILVKPGYFWDRYEQVPIACAVLNLTEWCHIVQQPKSERRRFRQLDNPENLNEMAILSARHLPQANFILINCLDSTERRNYGVILIAREGTVKVSAQRIKLLTEPIEMEQAGATLMLAGAMSVGLARLLSSDQKVRSILSAAEDATNILACYLDPTFSAWHKIPTAAAIARYLHGKSHNRAVIAAKCEITGGVLALPQTGSLPIDLAAYSIRGSRLVSQDEVYRIIIEDMIESFASSVEWNKSPLQHAILTGGGGTGKTEVAGVLRDAVEGTGTFVWSDFSSELVSDVDAALAAIRRKWIEVTSVGANKLIIIIDEALRSASHLIRGNAGARLLQGLEQGQGPTRFCFIDAELDRDRRALDDQFSLRCAIYVLPDIARRLRDIPLIFARACFNAAIDSQEIVSLKISEGALVGVVSWVLGETASGRSAGAAEPNVRVRLLQDHARQTVQNSGYSRTTQRSRRFRLVINSLDLPTEIRDVIGPAKNDADYFEFLSSGLSNKGWVHS
jgi:hypothetical protein